MFFVSYVAVVDVVVVDHVVYDAVAFLDAVVVVGLNGHRTFFLIIK